MQTLSEAIASFRRQIEDGLEQKREAASNTGPAPLAWQAERVTMSLEVALGEDGVPRVLAGAGDGGPSGGRHTVTVEFGLGSGTATLATESREPGPVQAQPLPKRGNERVIGLLTELFGSPGCDCSARASLYCEAQRRLGPRHEAELRAALLLSDKSVNDENLSRVRQLIRGVVQSGPLKSAERASAMLRVTPGMGLIYAKILCFKGLGLGGGNAGGTARWLFG